MILVSGTARVRPERREDALAVARAMAERTRQQPGCISSGYYTAIESPDNFVLVQIWENEEALNNHYRQEFVQQFLERLPELLDGATSIQSLDRYDVEE